MKKYIEVNSSYKNFYIISEDDYIVGVAFSKDEITNIKEEETEILKEAKKQLLEYFENKRIEFNLNYKQEGSDFFHKVWDCMEKIPYGKVVTYKDIAIAINHPKAFRAVGMACNRNNIPIFIPCHRVVGQNNKLVGYAGGLDVKEYLLRLEGYIK